jgi:uncharacterized protein
VFCRKQNAMFIEPDKLPPCAVWSHSFEPQEIDLDHDGARLTAPVEVRFELRSQSREVLLAGHIAAAGERECDRCLQPAPFSLALDVEAKYVTLAEYAALPADELSDKDLNLLVYDGQRIDVSELARGEILLALPEQFLCRPECLGLCPQCGADLNQQKCSCGAAGIDPRWAVLQSLKRETE